MKIFFLTFVFVLCFFCFGYSQTESKDVSVGVKIYPSLSGVCWGRGHYSDELDYFFRPKTTINGGVSILKEIKKNFLYLEAELLFLNRGYKLSIEDNYYNMKEETKKLKI